MNVASDLIHRIDEILDVGLFLNRKLIKAIDAHISESPPNAITLVEKNKDE
jgi:hypothetical protein